MSRPISVGVRVEHPQVVIDAARYGGKERGTLPPASYRLAWEPAQGRGAHTFCMCPGGLIVPASNLPGRVVVNGMSYSSRRSRWANAAVVAPVRVEDYGGEGPLAGLEWQDRIEQACFVAGGADGRAPAQRVVDFLAGRASTSLPEVSYPLGVTPCDLHGLLPEAVTKAIAGALEHFDQKLAGFAGPQGVLVAPETRTTSPIRFLRNDSGESTTLKGLYAAGEGAGFGGGIISCALDGYRVGASIARTT